MRNILLDTYNIWDIQNIWDNYLQIKKREHPVPAYINISILRDDHFISCRCIKLDIPSDRRDRTRKSARRASFSPLWMLSSDLLNRHGRSIHRQNDDGGRAVWTCYFALFCILYPRGVGIMWRHNVMSFPCISSKCKWKKEDGGVSRPARSHSTTSIELARSLVIGVNCLRAAARVRESPEIPRDRKSPPLLSIR